MPPLSFGGALLVRPWPRFHTPLIGRVEGWRAGRPLVPRFQSPPRRTQHADFPHCAPPFASRQSLWDLSCWGDFRPVASHSIGVKQPSSVVQPLPIPSFPAEALSFLSKSSEPPGRFSLRLTYSLRLRSCKSMDAFVISSLPSPMLETLQMAGPLRSTDITPLHRYYGPSRHPLVFGRLPGFAGYTAYLAPAISRRDEEGFSSCLACPCHRAVASTPPR